LEYVMTRGGGGVVRSHRESVHLSSHRAKGWRRAATRRTQMGTACRPARFSMVTTSRFGPTCRATSWCGPTVFPRHGPIGAVLPRSGGFPAVQPIRHLLGARTDIEIPSSPAVAASPLCSLVMTSAIASNAAIVGFRRAPCTTSRSSKGQLQQQRVT
jgi:hypothetical protein